MKVLKIILAVLFGLVVGAGYIWFDDEPRTPSRMVAGAVIASCGVAVMIWCKHRITWKFLVFLQVPLLANLVYIVARFQSTIPVWPVLAWAVALLLIMIGVSSVEARERRVEGARGRKGIAGQDAP